MKDSECQASKQQAAESDWRLPLGLEKWRMNIEFEGRASEGGVSSGFGKSHVTSWEADGTGQI